MLNLVNIYAKYCQRNLLRLFSKVESCRGNRKIGEIGEISSVGGHTGFSQINEYQAAHSFGRLPPVTVQDLQAFKQKNNVSFAKTPPAPAVEKDTHFQKYVTKFTIVLSSLLTTTLMTDKIFKLTENCAHAGLQNVARYGGPLVAALGLGAAISSAFQLIFKQKVDKEHLVNDLKDTFISSTMVRSFTAITSSTGKFLRSYSYLRHSDWGKRFAINGVIGSSYAALRGIIKPDKEHDRLTPENIAKGFVEGIFLGEGARVLSGVRVGNKFFRGKPQIIKGLMYLKLVLGAMLGSMLFGVADFGYERAKSSSLGKNHDKPFEDKSLVKHLFKGNSYPTLII